ncbi:S8 family serine peptidase [Fictibacillus barbaricus]|uniref:S8 family serine peptidase n=2 Tax=Fictibacillus barbaricus TaxID=182136 RepID=A0ABS2Z8Y0_9BACL|nr:S8 family serine peptidase [Fictibacillus barbaricus]
MASSFIPQIGFSQTPSTTRQVFNKTNQELMAQFEKETYVTFLVKLKQQVNVSEVASKAALKAKSQKKSAFQAELLKRSTLVSTLRTTAEETQYPLKQLLSQEKKAGRVKTVQSFYIVNAIAVTGTKEVAEKLLKDPAVDQIFPNQTIKLIDKIKPEGRETIYQSITSTPEWGLEKIGAPRVWKEGIDGTGVVVASIDTGVQWDHPALKEKYRGYRLGDPDHPDNMYNWFDAVGEKKSPYDDNGHGTHTTGTMVGSEPNGNNKIGVAPGAKWIGVKVFDSRGSGTGIDMLEGGEWILAPKDAQGNPHPENAPDVVNNSWSGGTGLDEWYRPMLQAWRAADIFPVFAAGNGGTLGPGSISHPGNYPESFAVGAIESSNRLAPFSSRGPSPYNQTKPDVSAPGVNIRSAVPGSKYESGWNGTSMAAPHVAGAVALLRQVNSSLSPEDIEEILIHSTVPLTDVEFPNAPNNGYGNGLINIYEAVQTLNKGVGRIQGHVTQNINGSPVGVDSQVTVLETGRSTKTNGADGSYALYQRSGDFTLLAEGYGIQAAKQRVTVVKNETTTVNFDMQPLPKGTIKGRVTNEQTGKPIANATISLIEDAAVAPVKTNKDGYFALTAYEGTYTLRISAPFYYKTTANIIIDGDQTTLQNAVLKPFIGYSEQLRYDDGTAESTLNNPNSKMYATKMILKEGQEKALLTGGLFMINKESPSNNDFQVAVYDASGIHGKPGKKIAGPFDATAQMNNQWTLVNLAGESIFVPKEFYLAFIPNDSVSGPKLRGDESSSNLGNWEYIYGWSKNYKDANYMIRAEVSYEIKTAPSITSPANGLFTNKPLITVKGKGTKPGTAVKIYNNGKENKSVPSNNDGSFTSQVTLGEGENILTAATSTPVGTTKPSSPVKVILDKIKPSLTIQSPVNEWKTNKTAVIITGKVSDKYLKSVKVNGYSVVVARNGTYSVRIPLNSGKNTIKAVALDKAGNQQTKQITIFTKYSAPTIKNIKPAKNIYVKTGHTVKIELDSQPGLKGSYIIRLPLFEQSQISISQSSYELQLREQKNGHYVGYWKVPSKLKDIKGAVIEVFMKDQYGNQTKRLASGKLYINLRK